MADTSKYIDIVYDPGFEKIRQKIEVFEKKQVFNVGGSII